MVIFWILTEVLAWEVEDMGSKQISALTEGVRVWGDGEWGDDGEESPV